MAAARRPTGDDNQLGRGCPSTCARHRALDHGRTSRLGGATFPPAICKQYALVAFGCSHRSGAAWGASGPLVQELTCVSERETLELPKLLCDPQWRAALASLVGRQ